MLEEGGSPNLLVSIEKFVLNLLSPNPVLGKLVLKLEVPPKLEPRPPAPPAPPN